MSNVGDMVELQKQTVKVEKCEECDHLMVNIDADQIARGDLLTLKRLGLRLSNPETKDIVCLDCDVPKNPTFRERLSSWFDAPEKDNDNDDSFFHSTPSSPSVFDGSSFGGGFGGFGGGGFSGGGASRSF